MSAYGKNLERFVQAINSHDRLNPTHTTLGLELSYHDIARLELEEGEEILPGIPLVGGSGPTSGNFRIICDGTHDEASGRSLGKEQPEPVHAVSDPTRETILVP